MKNKFLLQLLAFMQLNFFIPSNFALILFEPFGNIFFFVRVNKFQQYWFYPLKTGHPTGHAILVRSTSSLV